MVSISQPTQRTFTLGRVGKPAAAFLAAVGLTLLAVVASRQVYTDIDLEITRWVQSLSIPGLDVVSALANFLTSAPVAITLWLVVMAFFILKGRPVEAIAVFMISVLWLATQFVGVVVDRPVPGTELTGVVEFSRTDSGSFPSGHVVGAVVFYGLLSFLTFSNVRRGHLRVFMPALAIAVIGLSSLSRVYTGAHWPSDILGSYLMGMIGVAGIAWLYTGIKYDSLRIPRPWKRQSDDSDSTVDGVKIARSIASRVYLDPQAGTATKEYIPPFPVRALYWLAYQAPFPYQVRKDALEAAAAKRKIAGLLAKHWFGRDMVASVYGIENSGDSYRFVTEFVPGVEPSSNDEVKDFLAELYTYFQETGLPTWQIAPGNPHAYSNFIRKPDGELILIDLESALVSSTSTFKQLRAALRDGVFPVFDDVDFVQMRGYVTVHASELVATLGRDEYEELNQAIKSAEASTWSWRESEPRVWGRMGSWIYRRVDLSGLVDWVRRALQNSEALATAFLDSGVERWEQEGRIDRERAASLRSELASSDMQLVLKNIGAHMALSAALVVPIPGLRSAARFAWTLTFRIKARLDLAAGRIDEGQYAGARSIHSVPVMFISLVPALGGMAYLASGPVRKSGLMRLMLDQIAYKLPFALYRRLRLARVTAPRSPKIPGTSSEQVKQVAARRLSRAPSVPPFLPTPVLARGWSVAPQRAYATVGTAGSGSGQTAIHRSHTMASYSGVNAEPLCRGP